jgi:Tfp pilus assembly protein PilF
MRTLTVVAFAVLLAACASVPAPPQRADLLFDDARFTPATERIDAKDVFALTPEMREYLRTDIARFVRYKGSQHGLYEALHDTGVLKLEYDAAKTRNASQAFDARAGNCLSLVLMTAAFAKEMGLPVRFQNVFTDETWSRSGDFYLSIGHVNLTLGRRLAEVSSFSEQTVTIDFLPTQDIRGARCWIIDEPTIVAMYMNNRAVESLTAGDVNEAYWWAREAIVQEPKFLSAINTLGVVYQQHGDLPQAQRALEYALAREPANVRAMSNLASVLYARQQPIAAREMMRRLAQLEPDPPFGYFKRGLAAMHDGDYRLARDMFAKEVDRAAYYHEFHFWLALAYVGLGEMDKARAHMATAAENSTTRRDHDLYAAKLDRLRAAAPAIIRR